MYVIIIRCAAQARTAFGRNGAHDALKALAGTWIVVFGLGLLLALCVRNAQVGAQLKELKGQKRGP